MSFGLCESTGTVHENKMIRMHPFQIRAELGRADKVLQEALQDDQKW